MANSREMSSLFFISLQTYLKKNAAHPAWSADLARNHSHSPHRVDSCQCKFCETFGQLLNCEKYRMEHGDVI